MPHPVSTTFPHRRKASVDTNLDKGLAAYMAVGAAALGMLAGALPAQAKVVYTPTNQEITPEMGLSLDLTNNGVADFVFSDFYSSTSSLLNLSVGPVNPSNEIFSTGLNRSVFAAAIPAGVEIGPDGRFKKRRGEGMANDLGTQPICQGPWVHANERYLGLKFVINGEFHFGWARLNVNCVFPHPIIGTLTGYAYETVANKPIVTGQTQVPEAPDASALGALARGAAAFSDGHDEEPSKETH